MTTEQVFVLLCWLGTAGEALRTVRPGQQILAPDLLGRYREGSAPLVFVGERFRMRLLPFLRSAPALRVGAAASTADGFDPAAARRRYDSALRAVAFLLPSSQLLALVILVVLPLQLLTGRVPGAWTTTGALLLATLLCTLILYADAHRRLRPAQTGRMIQHLFVMLLFPPTGIFATEHALDGLFCDLHPLVMALELCPEDEAKRIAGRTLRHLSYPLEAERGTPPECWLKKCEDVILGHGWEPGNFLAAPAWDKTSGLAYCPRCLAQYVESVGECRDCPGVEVVTLERKS